MIQDPGAGFEFWCNLLRLQSPLSFSKNLPKLPRARLITTLANVLQSDNSQEESVCFAFLVCLYVPKQFAWSG